MEKKEPQEEKGATKRDLHGQRAQEIFRGSPSSAQLSTDLCLKKKKERKKSETGKELPERTR